MTSTNGLPPWARVMQKPVEMVVGSDLKPGDTIYFSAKAYPRVLWTKLSATSWAVMEERRGYHRRDHISVEPGVCYVVKRCTPRNAAPADAPAPVVVDDPFRGRPLSYLSVHGAHLGIGDVLYLDQIRKRAVILEIGQIVLTIGRGNTRKAKLDYLDQGNIADHTFSNFSLQNFTAIAGPKFEAARLNPSLVIWRDGVHRWEWKGN